MVSLYEKGRLEAARDAEEGGCPRHPHGAWRPEIAALQAEIACSCLARRDTLREAAFL